MTCRTRARSPERCWRRRRGSLTKLGVTLHRREDSDRACQHGVRVSRGTRSSEAVGRCDLPAQQDPQRGPSREPVRVSPAEVVSSTSRSRFGSGRGARLRVTTQQLIEEINPVIRGWGQLLLQSPRPQALQPTRSLDRAAYLVASIQALAMPRLEDTPGSASSTARWDLCNLVSLIPSIETAM